MHEAAITQALLEQVEQAMPRVGRLVRCTISIGRLEHLDASVMRLMWQASVMGTRLEGAELNVVHTPVRVRCGACGHVYEPEDQAIMLCPACGRVLPQVVEGSGVVLRSLEVEGA
ncbi:MAG: hypothetical protein Kow0022_13480 [Phycisphaerales bacterium]